MTRTRRPDQNGRSWRRMLRAASAASMGGRARRLHPRAVLARRARRHGGRRARGRPRAWPRGPTWSSSASPAGTARPPPTPWRPPIPVRSLPLPRPLLYEAWLRLRLAAGRAGHRAGRRRPRHHDLVPPRRRAARRDGARPGLPPRARVTSPATGVRVMRPQPRPSSADDADLVLCSSHGDAGRPRGRRRRRRPPPPRAAGRRPGRGRRPTTVAAVRRALGLPAPYLLFVGTLEPRKNLRPPGRGGRPARRPRPQLVVAGPDGWGDAAVAAAASVRLLGFVDDADAGRAVRRRRRVLLPEPARGVRPAGARGDGPGHAGRDQRAARRPRRWPAGRRARRPARRRRHRRAASTRPSAGATSWRAAGPARAAELHVGRAPPSAVVAAYRRGRRR